MQPHEDPGRGKREEVAYQRLLSTRLLGAIVALVLEPFREVWIPDQGFAATLRTMRRIMARRTNAAAFRVCRS